MPDTVSPIIAREPAPVYTRRFQELSKHDTESVGGKGANLGELTQAGFPVPPGFVITAQAYLAAMDAAGARARLQELASGVDPNDPAALESVSEELRSMVRSAGIPPSVRQAIVAA